MKRGDEAVVTIDAAAIEGKSVTRLEGLVIFVHGGVPGDEARIRIVRSRKKFAEAELLEVMKPSELRIAPQCRHFGVCGGCRWQHVDYLAQLGFKHRHVVDALERIGRFRSIRVNPVLGAEAVYRYRNKMEYSFGQPWLSPEEFALSNDDAGGHDGGGRFALGLHPAERFDKVLDIEECWLQSETASGILNAVRRICRNRTFTVYSPDTGTGYLRNVVIRESRRTGGLMVNIVTRDDNPAAMDALCKDLLDQFPSITTIVNNITDRKSQVAVGEVEKVYYGPGSITERIGGNQYRISANSFFQTNTGQAERLYDEVRRMAGITSQDIVFDLYSGTGTIALHLARDAAEVVGIESVESAVRDAMMNAANNGIRNCTFILGDLKDRLTNDNRWLADHPRPDVVIVDPPRAGMHEKVVRQLVALSPRRIVYVSCNPSTQARDLAILCEGGKYRIDEVQPVDMFPHTYHVESVVALSRVS